jgi:hypothetical protein
MHKLVAILLLSTGCGPHIATVGPPIKTVPVIAEPEIPEVADQGCVPNDKAMIFSENQDAYFESLKAQTAAQKGWKILDPPVAVQPVVPSSESDFDHTMGALRLKVVAPGRMVDTMGQHWLKVGETDVCRTEFGTVAMDAKNGVFSLVTYAQCEITQDLPVCGSIAIEGCGAQPPPELRLDWYVRVPEDAKLVQNPKESMAYQVPRCVILNPLDGFGFPP